MDLPFSSRLRSFESCKFSLSCSSNDNLGAALRKKSLKVSYRYRTFSNVCAKKYITFFEDFIPRTSCECFADNCSLTKGGFFRVLNLVFGKLAIVGLTKDGVFFVLISEMSEFEGTEDTEGFASDGNFSLIAEFFFRVLD